MWMNLPEAGVKLTMDSNIKLEEAEKQLLDAILSIELYPEANPEEADENIQAGEKMLPIVENLNRRGKLIQVTSFGKKANLRPLIKGRLEENR